ncbi:MAG TPA: ABC transporter permease [Gemmatimonadaceae bacterium]|jgi:predicted permease|nr:ABC transporter permease [Gemmatimonadaceae bacterium]
MTDFLQDIRYALRTFRRTAGLTAVIVASLAIGIGANSAVFSVVDALLLKPLPYPEPERLTVLWLRSPGINIPQDWPSPGQYTDIKNENRSFSELSISQGRAGTLIGRGGEAPFPEPQRVEALLTSSSLFHMLGAKARYGRLLQPDEDVPGKAPVVVLSNAFWKRTFNGDPTIVGKTIVLNGLSPRDSIHQFQVVGVLDANFLLNAEIMPTVSSTQQMDLFLPLPLGADAVNRRGDENYNLMARLKPNVTMTQAHADVAAIAARIRDKDKRDRTFTIDVVPLVESVVGNVRLAVLVLMGSVTLVLLIACANVANLLLTRASSRQKEIAVRVALGANWRRLVRQLLTETTLLGLMGGVAGLLVAALALGAIRAINPGNIPRIDAIGLDGRVLAFTFGVSILTGILFGLAPALKAARVDLNSTLKAGGRNTHGDGGLSGSRRRLRNLLVVAEVAISIVLLVGAGLLIRSFVQLQRVSPGFQPDGVVSMRLGVSGRHFDDRNAALAYWTTFGDQLASVPGVKERGAVSALPFTSSVGWGQINVEGWTPEPGHELQVDQRGATTNYFSTMRIPLIAGRVFTDADLAENAEPVVLIDNKFAQRFWPKGEAIGKHVWFNPARKFRIAGVVGTVKQYGLDVDGRIVVYMPSPNAGYQVARTTGDPITIARAMIRKMHDLDPTLTVYDVQTMSDRMSGSMARQRFATTMLGAFAAFALLLAVIGVYGVMSRLVAQGSHDIGVRMALGADRGGILLMILRRGTELTALGVVAGLVGAAALTRVMASLLFGISTTDAITFAVVPIILIATAMLATYIPALRATRVDPTVALREE